MEFRLKRKLIDSNMGKPALTGVIALACCMLFVATGCNQRRYKPAKWRPAARDNSTLPTADERKIDGPRWVNINSGGTMPSRGTLPYRAQGTLPGRGTSYSGTLPQRNWSTLPNRGIQSPRRFPIQNGQRWSTLPRRGGVGGTLPSRQIYPEYQRTPQRNFSTLPTNSRWTPPGNFPLRNQSGSTLPGRNPLR